MNSPTTILAGDLGGTKTLLAVFQRDKGLKNLYQKHYLSADWPSLEPMIRHFISHMPKEINSPEFGCIGVAGPVFDGRSHITNLGWRLDETQICASTNLIKLELINDFCVLIYGLPFLKSEQYVHLNTTTTQTPKEGVVAVIGAGTGLGIAKGLIKSNRIEVLPSEGGHKEFAPRSIEEWELSNWLKNNLQVNRLSIERIVSGTGLGHIANWYLQKPEAYSHPLQAIASTWRSGSFDRPDLPALVSKAAEEGDPLMVKALKLWLSAYGSAVGDLALHDLSTLGVWIAGGTAKKHINGLRSDCFLGSMCDKGRFKHFLEKMPLMALIDPEAGLFGAACRAHMLAELNGKLT